MASLENSSLGIILRIQGLNFGLLSKEAMVFINAATVPSSSLLKRRHRGTLEGTSTA